MDETEVEAVSDDDFQNESSFTRRTAVGAERQRVQLGKAKVCVATDGCAGCCDLNLNDVIYPPCFCSRHHMQQMTPVQGQTCESVSACVIKGLQG